MYHDVLSREVRSDDDIEGWTNHTRFHGIASTISEFFTGDQLQAMSLPHKAIVGKFYRSILGREGRGDEMNVQLDRLRHGEIHSHRHSVASLEQRVKNDSDVHNQFATIGSGL